MKLLTSRPNAPKPKRRNRVLPPRAGTCCRQHRALPRLRPRPSPSLRLQPAARADRPANGASAVQIDRECAARGYHESCALALTHAVNGMLTSPASPVADTEYSLPHLQVRPSRVPPNRRPCVLLCARPHSTLAYPNPPCRLRTFNPVPECCARVLPPAHVLCCTLHVAGSAAVKRIARRAFATRATAAVALSAVLRLPPPRRRRVRQRELRARVPMRGGRCAQHAPPSPPTPCLAPRFRRRLHTPLRAASEAADDIRS
jgi:hypothetical protein